MTMRRMVLAALLLLGGAAVPALAGERGEGRGWELGVYTGIAYPDSYASLDPENGLLYGVRVGCFLTPRWSLEGSYQTVGTDGRVSGAKSDVDLDALRLNLLYSFRPDKTFRWFLTAGFGNESTEAEEISETDLGWNAGGGARWSLDRQRRFALRADARWIEVDMGGDIGGAQSNYEATGGFLWSFGGGPPPDSDGDRVPDKKDKCAGTPDGAVVDASGCPQDADGDRVFDGLDKCAGTPSGWAVDTAGCPLDGDGDGVADVADKCPGTPKGVMVDPAGCPLDADGDGVWDGEDKCPGTPKGTRVDGTGCAAPEPAPSPVAVPVIPEARKPLVLEGVTFATDSAVLTPESSVVLDRVAAALKEHPEVRLEIGGHTDSTGDARRNQGLSSARAESVRSYLVGKGVPPGQLLARGYGSERPIADNSTDAGRALNRRVELSRIP